MATPTQLLDVARGELGKGQYEKPLGSNCTEYGARYGFNCVAWCAIWISDCCKKVGIPWRFASTVEARRVATRNGDWSGSPKAGMIAMKQYTSTTGHVGIVEVVHTDGTVTTVEGNTSPTDAGSQREGDGVYRKRRSRSWWSGFISLPFDVAQPPQEDDMPPNYATVTLSNGENLVYYIGTNDAALWEIGRGPGAPHRQVGDDHWEGGLAAVVNDKDEVTVFGFLRHGNPLWWYRLRLNADGSVAHEPDPLNGEWTNPPSAVIDPTGKISLFGRGKNGMPYVTELAPAGHHIGPPYPLQGRSWP